MMPSDLAKLLDEDDRKRKREHDRAIVIGRGWLTALLIFMAVSIVLN
jgi:hypothetical protein